MQLARTFDKWGVGDWSAEPNVPLSRVHSQHLTKLERSVTVRFWKDGREIVLSSDSQADGRENLKLIQLCVDDMRMIERRGAGEVMRSAYMQLPAPEAERDPYEVLSIRPGGPREVAEASYRALAKSKHSDAGGDDAGMAELNKAIAAVREREGWA